MQFIPPPAEAGDFLLDFVKRVGYGTYQANPSMFGRGEWTDIKSIRATFDFNTQTVEAEIKTGE